MTIYNDISSFDTLPESVITIGVFDGVHLGHQKIINSLIQSAKNQELFSTILTFSPHPKTILNPQIRVEQIQTINEKCELLSQFNINHLVIYPFDMSFAKLSAEKFIKDFLIKKLNMKKLIVGYDHRLGHNRQADINVLRTFGKIYNFTVEEILPHKINNISVSSTQIRNALHQGNISIANAYLGRNFSISGKVIHGEKIGRTIGYPTANIAIDDPYKIVPKNGVYSVQTSIDGIVYKGMMNIGNRPTVGGKNRSIEVHLFDFQGNLYEKTLHLSLLSYLREQQKFDSIEILKTQLQKDEKQIKEQFKTLNL